MMERHNDIKNDIKLIDFLVTSLENAESVVEN